LNTHATSSVPAVDPAGRVSATLPLLETAGPICTFANAI
jgi:hypothetical protein